MPEQEKREDVPVSQMAKKPISKFLLRLDLLYFPLLLILLLLLAFWFRSFLGGGFSLKTGVDLQTVREKVERVLRYLGEERVFIRTPEGRVQVSLSELLVMVESKKSEERRFAAWCLRKFPRDLRTLTTLIRVAADPDPQVRGAAIDSLWVIRTPDAFPVFIKALSDPSIEVRAFAVSGLGDLGDPKAVDPLLLRLSLEDKNEMEIISRIVDSLGKLGDPKAIESIRPFAESPDMSLRKYARIAVSKLEMEKRQAQPSNSIGGK